MRSKDIPYEVLKSGDPQGRLFNEDLAPSKPQDRNWGTNSLFFLWMNDAHNATNYMFAAGLYVGTSTVLGMSPLAIMIGVFIGTIVIFTACNLTGFMGYETGAPYPVISRVTWGVRGANFPAIVRGIVAIAWFGISTYVGSIALEVLIMRFIPGFADLSTEILGLRVSGWIAFLLLMLLQLAVVWRGMPAVRHFQGAAGPIIWVIMLGLGIWMLARANWQFSWTTNIHGVTLPMDTQVYQIFVTVGLTVGTLATLMLNFSDFARYAPSKRSVVIGNLLGLPLNWTLFAITAVVCSASAWAVYGEAIHDPGDLIKRIENDPIFLIVSIGFIMSTVGVNIVADYVSAAFDLANVAPKHLTFQRAGIVAVVVSVIVTPWNLYNTPAVINYFLGGLGALLGPFFGILVLDYFYYKRSNIDLKDLYSMHPGGRYWYVKGVNPNAVIAFVPAAIVSLAIALVPLTAFEIIAPFSWFIAAPLGALCYWLVVKVRGDSASHPPVSANDDAEEQPPYVLDGDLKPV
jgi:NCS1 family nucleobase:cation symporter-1